MTANQSPESRPHGAAGFYVVAVMGTLISVDTSWRFFGEVLRIDNLAERAAMFAVLETALVACGYGMRANVRRGDSPGGPRMLAWVLCGLSAYMAVALSGPVAGLARVALGPALALVALHLALGIEIRARRTARTGVWARVGRELRERALSRLGLADDERDALARTRDRAAARAARLATSRGPWRRRRLARAVRASGATVDAERRERLVEQVAALRHLDDLVDVDWPSPWRPAAADSAAQPQAMPVQQPARQSGRAPRRTSAGAPDTTASRIAQVRAKHPNATQPEVAKQARTSVRTVARYWPSTTPAGNGGPVPATAVANAGGR